MRRERSSLAIEPNAVPPPMVIQEILVDGEMQTGDVESLPLTPSHSGGVTGRSNDLTLPAHGPATKEAKRAAARFAALITPPNQITIPPGDHRLEISYAALSFAQPERNRYKYRLDGFDKDWIDAGTRRRAEYPNLPPGQYRFRVLGSNNDGVWSETAASLAVIWQPFLWQRNWFVVLAALILIGGVAGGLRHLEMRRVRRRMETLEQQLAVSKERTRIARDIHDDLGARLTQIGLLSELARRKSATPEETRQQVEKIADRTRSTVQAMDEIVWAVDPSKDTLDQLANYLAASVREMFEDAPMRCHLDLPDRLPPHPLSAEVRHHLLLVVKEALHNALKHSGATEVGLRLTFEDGSLTIGIRDNGQGFERATLLATTGGNGLKNMEQRVRSLGGEFALESRPGDGTRIELRMKLT